MSGAVRIESPVLSGRLYTPECVAAVLERLPAEASVTTEDVADGMRLWLLAQDLNAGERELKEILNQVLEVSLECQLEKL